MCHNMYWYESWTIKKAEHRRINAFKLWCWRRLLRVPWTARRSNQSTIKEINPEYSLEGLMLMLKLQYFGHLMSQADSLEKILLLGKIEGKRRRGIREWGVAPVGVSFSWLVCGCCCYCVTMSIFWGLRSSQRWLVCHLGPVWFWSVYVMSSGYVILSNIVPCPFCFRFTWGWSQLLQEKGGAWEDGHIPGLRQVPEMGHQMWALGFAWERTQEWVGSQSSRRDNGVLA